MWKKKFCRENYLQLQELCYEFHEIFLHKSWFTVLKKAKLLHDKLCYRLRILNQILVSNDFLLYDVFGTYLQCFSTRLLSAIFSPISVQTGLVSPTLAKSAFTAITRPPVDKEPIFTINTSFFDNFWTCKFKIKF